MRDLRQVSGARDVSSLPVALIFVRTLEEFEGPRLAEFKSESGDTFLYHWCDRQDDVSRWIVFRTPPQSVNRYLVGLTNLRELIKTCRDGFVYLVDVDDADHTRSAFYVTVDSVPDDYIPTERSYYEPADSISVVDNAQQDVFVDDEEWGYHEISEYPRRYLQAYGFNALFGPHGDTRGLGKIDYKLTQGYVYNTLFVNFDSHIPQDRKASLVEVSVASPGYFRFAVDSVVAGDLREAVTHYLGEAEFIRNESLRLVRWANGNENEKMSEAAVSEVFGSLCRKLHISAAGLKHRTDTLQTAVKAFRAYVKRLEYLAVKDVKQSAMLVGLKRNPPRDGSST